MAKPKVLVAYASKHGATAEIAEELGSVLEAAGVSATVAPAREIKDVHRFDAVILGSAVYMTRWRPEARAFARRHAPALRDRPVWLFSSGPLDAESDGEDLRAPLHAERVAEQVRAREHVIFGGALDPEARGFVTRRMVEGGLAGDYRDHDGIRDWAKGIAGTLLATTAQT